MVSNIPLKLIKIGNSKGVIMPKKVLKALNSEKNYFLELKELS
jgi:antitoxin component of MazEF toxin-antitoxin module